MRYFITTSDLITRANTYINSVGNRVGRDAWLDFITSSIKVLRANRILPWMKREYSLPVFTDIFKYPLTDDFDAIIDCNPPLLTDDFVGKQLIFSTEKEFKKLYQIGLAIGWENGEKFLLCRCNSSSNDTQIDDFDNVATDYTLAGDASNAVSDTSNYRSGSASLKFDVADVTHSFTISRTIDSLNLSTDFSLATVFVQVYMPATLANVKLRIGNSASIYYETSAITKQYSNTDFVADWNELGFLLSDATQVGSVDLTNITYMAVVGDSTGVTAKNFRVDGFIVKVGTNQVLSYNSYNIVRDSAGVWKAKVTDINDQILWDQDYDDLLLFRILDKAGFFSYRDIDLVQNSQGYYAELEKLFESRFPSQEARNRTTYYRQVNKF